MRGKEHIKRHKELHRSLDELLADWIKHTENLPSQHNIGELLKWSYEQTKNPTI